MAGGRLIVWLGLAPVTMRRRWATARPDGVQNCKRKTFATNWVAAHGDPGRLALLLGHTSTEVGFRHYVGGTTRALGLTYFEIRP